MTLLLELIKAIPTALWVAALGATTSLSGVVIGNYLNNKRQSEFQREEREHRERDRDLLLKKDLLIPAIEAISKALTLVAATGDVGTPLSGIVVGFHTTTATLDKILLVADTELIMAIKSLQIDVASSFSELMLKRIQLDKKVTIFQNEVKESDNAIDINSRYDEILDETLALSKKSNITSIDMYKKFGLIIGRAREELGLSFDEAQLHAIMEQSIENLQKVYSAYTRND